MKKEDLRTQKVTFWWRWWDEAEHKSTPEKRLAFYDALMRYIFLGESPTDPTEMDMPKGEDWAAYDATHYFDIIDSNVGNFIDDDGNLKRKRGAQLGNSNARKNKTNESGMFENESGNESETNDNETLQELRIKNEERRIKNEEESVTHTKEGNSELRVRRIPDINKVLLVAKNGAIRAGGEVIPEHFARQWFAIQETAEWRDTRGRDITQGWKSKLAFAWQDEKQRVKREQEKTNKGIPSNIHHKIEGDDNGVF